MGMTDPTPNRRWFHTTPDRIVIGVLVVEFILWLSERFQWFGFNQHKGWTVVIAVALVGAVFLLMLPWFVIALLFRRRFQFSIRSLLVMVIVVAVPCSWLAMEMKAAMGQENAIAAIRRSKGHVEYDYEFETDETTPFLNEVPHGPTWLRNLVGDDFFNGVWSANIQKDADIAHIKRFRHLHCLSFSRDPVGNRDITDVAVESLDSLPDLVYLDAWGTRITDVGMKQVGRLIQLEHLDVHDTRITDVGLERLKRLRQLQWLSLGGTRVTKQGIKNFHRALPNCEIVLD